MNIVETDKKMIEDSVLLLPQSLLLSFSF